MPKMFVTKTLQEEDFLEVISSRTTRLLRVSRYYLDFCTDPGRLTRPLLGEMLSQAMQIEELLDSYGAKNNLRWYPLRSCIAAIKLFADVTYELKHIFHRIPNYRLMDIDEDFVLATSRTLGFCWSTLYAICDSLLHLGDTLGLPAPLPMQHDTYYVEQLPTGQLPQDRQSRQANSVEKTVTLLATAFLNLAAESKLVKTSKKDVVDYHAFIPDPISEKNLRDLQHKFHNLQSLYDTYVSETRTEIYDVDLPVLRGHVSVIFHLLQVATQFAHYFERHIHLHSGTREDIKKLLVDPDQLLTLLIEYAIHYAERYQTAAQQLCQNMLKRYTEVDNIEVSVPRYRGFHVRPSTLVARIVMHYGSDVCMELEGQSYNAGSPMDIFRVNEKINARKRKWLSSEIVRLHLVPEDRVQRPLEDILRGIILTLAEMGKMVLYEQPLVFPEKLNDIADAAPLQRITEELARMQALGKIDIQTELTVTFIGDKRVLNDIRLLAENGYGEDNFGNNIPLPPRLQYLRN